MFLDSSSEPSGSSSSEARRVEDLQELPTGVMTMLTRCYVPSCTEEDGCYSFACPRRGTLNSFFSKASSGLQGMKGEDGIAPQKESWVSTVPKEVLERLPESEINRQTCVLAPAFDAEEWNKTRGGRSWEERSEANSRGGDDEDDGSDDNAEHRRWTQVSDREEEHSPGGTVRVRSRRDSNSVSASYGTKGKKKEYRVRGVQTIPREMRSQGVQVDMNIDSPKVPLHHSQDHGRTPSSTFSRGAKWVPKGSPPSAGVSPGLELPMTTASPTPVRTNSLEGLPTSTPTGMRSPRELTFPGTVGPLASRNLRGLRRSPPSIQSKMALLLDRLFRGREEERQRKPGRDQRRVELAMCDEDELRN